jgi:nucleotide-binding universal stress UspA family protein
VHAALSQPADISDVTHSSREHSVGRRLVSRTVAPLLVVRGAATRPVSRRHRAGGLLLGLESDADADAALFAFEEAELHGARLDVLHAWTYRQTPPDVRDGRPGTLLPLRRTSPHLALNSRTVRSTPCRALIAATADADMVVIGTHPRRGGNGPEPGPVTLALLRHAHCPVAIVPALASAEEPRG